MRGVSRLREQDQVVRVTACLIQTGVVQLQTVGDGAVAFCPHEPVRPNYRPAVPRLAVTVVEALLPYPATRVGIDSVLLVHHDHAPLVKFVAMVATDLTPARLRTPLTETGWNFVVAVHAAVGVNVTILCVASIESAPALTESSALRT